MNLTQTITVKDIRQIQILFIYCKNFVENYSKLAKPLQELTGEGKQAREKAGGGGGGGQTNSGICKN